MFNSVCFVSPDGPSKRLLSSVRSLVWRGSSDYCLSPMLGWSSSTYSPYSTLCRYITYFPNYDVCISSMYFNLSFQQGFFIFAFYTLRSSEVRETFHQIRQTWCGNSNNTVAPSDPAPLPPHASGEQEGMASSRRMLAIALQEMRLKSIEGENQAGASLVQLA